MCIYVCTYKQLQASQVALVKNPPANARDVGDAGSILGLRRSSGGGRDNTPQYACLEKLHGQGSLMGYCP